jgi:release factor glutamine methyltransferase
MVKVALSEALALAARRLAEAGIEAPRREARALAAHLLGTPPGLLLDKATPIDEAAFNRLVARRAAREPFAFITGRRGFWTLDLEVTPDTLIPRPDTEILIEAALRHFPRRDMVRRILDLGTGTGCLLLASLSEFSQAFGVGVDVSPEAAALASRNAARNALSSRAAFIAGSWADALHGTFDLVFCNPPYIESGEIANLMPEVALHEPRRALDGGEDGLREYAALMPVLRRLLAPWGLAILELGAGQHCAVQALAEQEGLNYAGSEADLAGILRAAKISL